MWLRAANLKVSRLWCTHNAAVLRCQGLAACQLEKESFQAEAFKASSANRQKLLCTLCEVHALPSTAPKLCRLEANACRADCTTQGASRVP